MRISTSQMYTTNMANISQAQSRYVRAQQQVTTGRRFEKMSEDPLAGQQVLNARRLRGRIEQFDKNLRHADEYVGVTETTLGEVSDLMKRAQVLAISGANDTNDANSREAMATEIQEIQKRLVDLGNTRTSTGGYVFSGQDSKTEAFVTDPNGALTYQGDDLPVVVEHRAGETMRINLSNADSLWSTAYSALESLKNHLRSGQSSLIGDTDVQALVTAREAIDQARGEAGVTAQSVSFQRSQNQKRMDDLTAQIGEAQDVDLAEAISRLNLAETAYTAALQTTARVSQLSLMDFLR
ncbi:MAG: flagellar hook-associated protein FlgL [Fimbriimonadaceae bacterium]|nr:flagellar hook-associated protein FlgL [Fimbriimonadaceae bacterium]